MVRSGNKFALNCCNKIVDNTDSNDIAAINNKKGNRFKAVIVDFCGNIFISSIPQTFMGLGVVFPFFTSAYQGLVGGIVSGNGLHHRRLKK